MSPPQDSTQAAQPSLHSGPALTVLQLLPQEGQARGCGLHPHRQPVHPWSLPPSPRLPSLMSVTGDLDWRACPHSFWGC